MTGRTFVLAENQTFADALEAEGVLVDDVPAESFPRPEEFSEDFADLAFLPVAHFSGSAPRTALCNRPLLGVPTSDVPFVLCPDCRALAAWLMFTGDAWRRS